MKEIKLNKVIVTMNSRIVEVKGLFTPRESDSESKKGQRTIRKDQNLSDKHQKKISLSFSISLPVNWP